MTTELREAEKQTPVRFWNADASGFRVSGIRLLVLVLGIAGGQTVLYGPSLIGARVLLPLDVLKGMHVYLPTTTADTVKNILYDPARTDLIVYYEPARQFAISELRAGRFPWWSPYEYGGVGCYRWNLSPPWLVGYLIKSPVVLAWNQMLVAMTAGGGAYVFFRRVLRLGFWPAVIVAWCYPLTGAYVFWQGFWLPSVMCWLPWVLTAVESVVLRPAGWGGPMLALLCSVAIASGAPDVAGQVLLASGIYASGRVAQLFLLQRRQKRLVRWRARYAAVAAALAWTIGILSGAWTLLPLAEYMQTGARSAARGQGAEERPPIGVQELPQVVLPDMYGSYGRESHRIVKSCIQESSAGAYAGMLATLLLAPLALTSRRHRGICILAAVLAFVGLGWVLNVPILVQLLRLPGLNLLSHNRFVFVTAFAILVLAAVGLNALWEQSVSWRGWFLLPMVVLGVLLAWCVFRAVVLPDLIATKLAPAIQSGKMIGGITDMAGVIAVQNTYRRTYVVAALLAALALAAWVWIWKKAAIPRWGCAALGAMLVGDLLWFGFGRIAQEDPSLYYPRQPVLEQLAALRGHVIGLSCLPANLAATHGLHDVRGYDGVDPSRWVELLKAAGDPTSIVVSYALIELLSPKGALTPDGLTLHPIMNMLNVRYVIERGTPRPGYHPLLHGGDYIIWENPGALPRAFVPKRVETIAESKERIRRLSEDTFDPREIAFVEQAVELRGECNGTAEISDETPQRLTLATDMKTPGLIVLSDRWDAAWNAYLDGKRVPILCTNHAIRGVVVPAGRQELQFRYEPAMVFTGAIVSGIAVVIWLVWVAVVARVQCGRSASLFESFEWMREEVSVAPERTSRASAGSVAESQQRGQATRRKRKR
jgi:hypothetical protein